MRCKYKKLIGLILFALFVLIIFSYKEIEKDNEISSIKTVEMINDKELSLQNNSNIKFEIYSSNLLKINNNVFYKWTSSNESVATVDDEGVVKVNKAGTTTIIAKSKSKTLKTIINAYDIKKIAIVVGDSRMDHFKDDNKFSETSRYEIKYIDNNSILSDIDRLYVVSLSGMRYNWLAGEDDYKENNATNYVKDIIKEYEDKTNGNLKYDIKIMVNLGVNDLSKKYLKDDTASEVAMKYLDKFDSLMNGEWKSNVINKISLNVITLFPVNDEMIDCYFPGRYNKDVIEFNKTIINNSKYKVCDAYNDLKFKDIYFRQRSDKSCATRDGLHFTKEFNKNILYPYLINVCSKI
jgi:hypothetical protein